MKLKYGAWLAVAVLVQPLPLAGQEQTPAHLDLLGRMTHPRLRESSGIAASHNYPGIYWTHNDSGDRGFIYAISSLGTLLAAFEVDGARSNDWEDIALGPCPREWAATAHCLYIADTGDNRLRRDDVDIYIVQEPDPGRGSPDEVRATGKSHRLEIEYPDGSYDVEAVAVSPGGDVHLVNKGRRNAIFHFMIPAGRVLEDETRAEFMDRLGIVPFRNLGRWVTGAAISPTGGEMVVRTYTELYFFELLEDGRIRQKGAPCWIGAAEPQGEAVDYMDPESLILTSESVLGRPGTIYRARCPRSNTEAPD